MSSALGLRIADLETNPDAEAGPAQVGALGVGEDTAEAVVEVEDQPLPRRPHDAAAEREHRLGNVAREIAADRHVLRERAGGGGAAELKGHLVLDARHAETAEDVRPDLRLLYGDQVLHAAAEEQDRLLDRE